jgi:hypothetical protein
VPNIIFAIKLTFLLYKNFWQESRF